MSNAWGWGKLAYFVDHKFRSFRGRSHDPDVDGDKSYPSIVEVLITPHRFLRHVLEAT